MLPFCMTTLKLVTEEHEPLEPLDDHEINLNRIDCLINSIADYENPSEDPYYYLIAQSIVDLVKVKHLYLAWLSEEI